ncbi:hypothetical protein F5X97DRAFT_253774 [Nemania serpens]|nr:hypothetical protein F5X97DRAFT_253774 [Nemania serpens]
MLFTTLATALGCLLNARSAIAEPYALQRSSHGFAPRAITSNQIQMDLGPQLSPNASLWFPGSDAFAEATSRWNVYGEPNISTVVEVATADDVATTVRYANANNIPFYAVNRGHGSPTTQAKLQGGIEIWVAQLDDIVVAEDGNSAVIGGGIYVDTIISGLAQYGKTGASGACGCVGVVGAGLGGGHGRLQGFFGLVVDNFLAFDLVLWNGTQISVDEDSQPDLFWALRGAGHNFGIVTSFTYKIYDEPAPLWYWGSYYFLQDQLENIFEELNRLSDDVLPPEVGLLLLDYVWNTDISTTEPVLVLSVNYAGTAEQAEPYMAGFKSFGPISVTEGEAPYSQIAKVSHTDVGDPLCSHGTQRMQFAADLTTYNLTTNRAVFDLYSKMTVGHPELQGTIVVFESYSLGAVQDVSADSTAYPHRSDNIIWTIVIQYEPDPSLDAAAIAWGEQTRDMIHAGQDPDAQLNVYVNYAFGNETLPSMYGYEPWRLEKLRSLKKEWDPQGKFSFYMPIY